MSVFLKMAGATLMMLGIGLGLTIVTKPGMLDALGIRLDTAALLLIGGILATGQSAIVDGLKNRRTSSGASSAVAEASAAYVAPVAAVSTSLPNAFTRKPDLAAPVAAAGAKTLGMAAVAGAGLAAVAAKATSKDPVAETISALEQAKADVIKSIGGMDATTHAPVEVAPIQASPVHPVAAEVAHAPEPAAVDEETSDEPELDEEGLFVVEEKVVRGRPARILSDDTVEAETDEGWMRFENMEHLNEYLDSVEEQSV